MQNEINGFYSKVDWPFGDSGKPLKDWLLAVEETLTSEYGELCSAYRKEMTSKLQIYQKIAVFSISAH